MFGIEELKESIQQDETTIECPVKKRTRRVKIMRSDILSTRKGWVFQRQSS